MAQSPTAWIKTRVSLLGRLEKTFGVLLLLYIILSFTTPGTGFVALLQLVVVVLGLWLLIRAARVGIRRAIWRLRNRLLMTYMLIAVVPILLIVLFVGIGTYALSSQLAVYLVSSELDRRIAWLDWVAHAAAEANPQQRPQVLHGIGEVLQRRLPDAIIVVHDRAAVQSWPNGVNAEPAPAGWGDVNGILVRDGHFYSWSHVVNGGADVTITAPLSRTYLSDLIPGLGEVSLFVLSSDPRAPRTEMRQDSAPTLGPAQNRFDVDLLGGSLMPFAYWNTPGKVQTDALLSVHTRPSALLRTVFNAKVDAVQQFIPVALFSVAILFLLVEALSLVVGVSLARTITAAVHQLYTGTQRVMEGDFSHRITVSAKSRDQLAELSTSFNTMTENLERLLAVAKEKERLQTELEIAREVQEQLYPKEIPFMKTVRLTAFWQSARIVSGDYFDYQRLGEDQLALAIGDVAGKGISAALLMATIQSAMRMEVRGTLEMAAPGGHTINGLSAARVVSDLNRQLHETTPTEKFATFCFGIYDEKSGVFSYTNAGHLPPILVHNGSAKRLDVNGMVVGAFPFAHYDESQVRLQPGDMLVFFTDGITEPENEYGEMFGEDRLTEIFVKNADRSEDEIIKTVMTAVGQWSNAPERQDDMTLLIARRL